MFTRIASLFVRLLTATCAGGLLLAVVVGSNSAPAAPSVAANSGGLRAVIDREIQAGWAQEKLPLLLVTQIYSYIMDQQMHLLLT